LICSAQEKVTGDLKPRHKYENKVQEEVCEREFGYLHTTQAKLAACGPVTNPTAMAICERLESNNIDSEVKLLNSMHCLESQLQGRLDADDVINILNRASEKGWKPDKDSEAKPLPKGGQHNAKGEPFQEGDDQLSANCSQYFREIMREFKSRGFAVNQNYMNDDLDANAIIREIRNRRDEWKLADETDAQQLANQGALVEGVAYYSGGHGHLATVFPNSAGADVSQIDPDGTGPLVRDGNEHFLNLKTGPRLYAGTWGAIRASKAFVYSRNPPTWYVWVPSTK